MIIDNTDFNKITEIVNKRREEEKTFNDTYIRRHQVYPQFLKIPYWYSHFETVFALNCDKLQGNILDFGCGSGHMDLVLARAGKKVHGIDLSTIAIDIANYIRSCEEQEVQGRLSFSLEDISAPPKNNIKFDTVMSMHVFEHIKDPGPIMKGIAQRVKPGALMIVSVPIGYAYNDPDHVNHYMNEEDLKKYFAPYVKVEYIEADRAHHVFKAYLRF